jgi:hypothetical protein
VADTEIKDVVTANVAPAATDWLLGQEAAGGSDSTFKVAMSVVAGYVGPVVGISLNGDSILGNPADNVTDATAIGVTNFGAGGAGFPNRVGVAGSNSGDPPTYARPVGVDLTPGWSADTAYVAGAADYCGILGGYDDVVNAVGSFIVGSNHSMISYGTEGHNLIAGNSYNWIAGAAGRSSIIGARQSSITNGAYHVILGGDNCDITSAGARSTIINGLNSTVSGAGNNNALISASAGTISAGAFGTVIGGETNSITATSNRNLVLAGSSNVVSGTSNSSAIIGGTSNSVASANNAVALGGTSNALTRGSAVAMGNQVKTVSSGGLHIGRGITTAGDSQAVTAVMGIRTTNNTATNLTDMSGLLIELDDLTTTTGTGTIWLTGVRESDGTQVIYKTDFGFMWNGTNGFLAKTGTETTVTASPTLALDLISQANNDFTPGAVELRINTGALRPNVTGIAAVNIKWAARIDLVMVTVA